MRPFCYLMFLTLYLTPAFASIEDFLNLHKLQKQGAKVSAIIVNLNRKKIIAESSAHMRLTPASVSKLVIGAYALETWGPDKTFNSKIYQRGTLKDGTLNGDLIFYGGGDPYLTNEKLWFLTTDVARYGINKVTGKIIVNNSLFGYVKEDDNRNHGKKYSVNAYDSPLSSAAVNFSVLAIVVSPAQQIGKTALVSLEPYNLPSVKIINHVTTTKLEESHIVVERSSNNGIDTFKVSGNISVDHSVMRIYRSVSNAELYAGEVIESFLNHAGVKTSGNIKVENNPISNDAKVVASVEGFPIAWQLRGLFEVSNNFIADMLTMDIGEHFHTKKDNLLQSSSQHLEKYLEEVVSGSELNLHPSFTPGLEKLGSSAPIKLLSGSGLTPENKLSAQDVIALLSRMYFKGRVFPEFVSSLALPGGAGSLKHRFQNNKQGLSEISIRAKTGTLQEPVDVASLAGYTRLQNGEWAAFAIIVNGSSTKHSFGIENIRSAIDGDLTKCLEWSTQ